MKKYLILILALLASINISTYAQDEGGFGAKAGDITGSILFGKGHFLAAPNVPDVPGTNTNWTVSGQTPYANTVSGNENYMSNMVGFETSYFVTDRIAITLSGGAIMRQTPGLQNVQYYYLDQFSSSDYGNTTNILSGNDPNSSNAAWIPQYGSVVEKKDIETNLNLGGKYYFPSSRFKRVFPYVGATLNYYYSLRQEYDPSIYYMNSSSATGTGGTGMLVYDIGVRTAAIQGMGAQAVAGVDVYVVPGVYVGLSTRPASYLYTWSDKIPAPGMESLQAESSTLAFFAQTFFKVGFIIGKIGGGK
jgi:outer membrane protein W